MGTIDQSKFFKDAHNPPLFYPYGWVMARSQAGYGQVMDLTGRLWPAYRQVTGGSWAGHGPNRQVTGSE